MVENNNHNDDTTPAPRRRKGLFGSRRARSSDIPATPVPAVQAPVQQAAAQQAPVQHTPVQQAAVEAAPVADAQTSSTRPEQGAAPEQTEAPVTDHESDPTQIETTTPETVDPDAAAQPAETQAQPAETAPARRTRTPRAKITAPAVVDPDAETDLDPAPIEATPTTTPVRPPLSVLFQAPDLPPQPERASAPDRDDRDDRDDEDDDDEQNDRTSVRRRSRRRSGEESRDDNGGTPANTVVKVRQPRQVEQITEPQKVRGSTRLEAKKQRRRDGRDAGRRRTVITESEFLARRESVDRKMVVRSKYDRIQIGVLEDGVLSEHYVAKAADASLIGNVYLGRVQNVLPSMEAAFVDIGRGRNAVLYSGEVDWEAAAANSEDGKQQARRIELALKPGDRVLVQVTKDPIGHKGARLTSQVSLPGRYLVYVPNGSMNGISRKLPDTERARLKKILKEVLPDSAGVIVRTAAEGATEEQLTLDVNRLTTQWAEISRVVETSQAPALLHSEPDLLLKIVRDVFNEDFHQLVIEGQDAEATISSYLAQVAPDLIDRIERYEDKVDSFDAHRITEQIEKALERKVWLPSGGSLVIDRTEAMTVVDVNTGKFVGSGGNLEETVTKNNLEAAEEIVRQLRLRDIGGIIVVDFIDMVLETNRDLVLRRLVECLSRDRTKHQVAEVTSLGLVQMTRKKLGLGLVESFSENCEVCAGRGIIVHHDPVTKHRQQTPQPETGRRGRGKGGASSQQQPQQQSAPKAANGGTHAITDDVRSKLAQITTATIQHAADAAAAVRAEAEPVVAPAEEVVVPEAAIDAPAAPAAAAETRQSDSRQSDSRQSESRQGEPRQSERGGRSGRGRGRGAGRGAQDQGPASHRITAEEINAKHAADTTGAAKTEPTEQPERPAVAQTAAAASDTVVKAAEAAVQILDIPLAKAERAPRKISTRDAEQILDSVLDALPEPKQPGQGRSRTSRRASSAGTVTAAPPVESE